MASPAPICPGTAVSDRSRPVRRLRVPRAPVPQHL